MAYKVGTPQIDTAVGIGLIPDGITDNSGVFSTYTAFYSANPSRYGTLEITEGSYYTTVDVTFPENLKVVFSGGQLVVEATKTATFLGPVEGLPYTINTGDGGFVIAGNQDYVLPQWWGIVGDGVTDNMTELGYLVTSMASNRTKVLFTRGTYLFSSGGSQTLDQSIDVEIAPDAIWQVTNSTSITMLGQLKADLYQVFDLQTSGIVNLQATPEVYPEWWGALADDSTDCSTALTNCLAALPVRQGVWSNGAALKSNIATKVVFNPGRWNGGSSEAGYRFNTVVTIPNYKSIHFDGGGRHGSRLVNNTGGDWILQVDPAFNSFQWVALTFDGLIFDDGGLKLSTAAPTINHSAQGGRIVRDCTFYAAPNYAIEVGQRYVWGWIQRCTFDTCGGGVHFSSQDSDLWVVEECSFLRETTYPSVRVTSSGITIRHCDFEVRSGGGLAQSFIEVNHPATDLRILDNRFGNEPDHPVSAIQIGDSGDDTNTGILGVTIRGNQFKGDGVPGVNVAEAAIRMYRPLQRSEITHNFFWTYTDLIDDEYVNQASSYARYSYNNIFSNNTLMFWDSKQGARSSVFVNGGSGWACDFTGDVPHTPESAPVSYAHTQDFSSGTWTKSNCSVAQDVDGPDGVTNSGWTMTRTAGGSCYLLGATMPLTSLPRSRTMTVSIWAKAGTNSSMRLHVLDGGNRSQTAFNNPLLLTDEWRLYQEVVSIQGTADTVRVYVYQGLDGTSDTTGTILISEVRLDFGDQAHVPAHLDPSLDYVDLQDFVTGPQIDADLYTGAFTWAIAKGVAMGRHIRIPKGTWPVQDVDPISGMSIRCDRGAVIQADGGTGAIFLDASGGLKTIDITGGSWNSCNYVLQRTNTSSMLHSRFESMSCSASTIAFEMESSIQNVWSDCVFSGVGTGIQFNSATQSNINTIKDCQFQSITSGKAIISIGVTNPNNHLAISHCWFEAITNGAIELEGSVRNIDLESCYFEGNGSAGAVYDVEFHTDGGGQGRQLVVSNCHFANPHASQTAQRIGLRGQSHAVVRNCVGMLNSGQHFINYAVSNVYVSEFWNNYLSAPGGGTYQANLFDDSATNDPHWSSFPGSASGLTDVSARTYFSGVQQADQLRPYSDTVSSFTGAGTAVAGRINHVDASGGVFTLDLPNPGTGTGLTVLIKNVSTSANAVTIDGNGNTIDGDATFEFAKSLGTIEFAWDGSEWNLIRNDPPQSVFSPTTAAGSAVLVSGDQEFGATATWPSGSSYAKAVVSTNDVHVRFSANEYDVITFDDIEFNHAVASGGDNAFAVDNYLRGLTSGAVGIIKEVISTTRVRVAYEIGSAAFQLAETVNETTTGLAGGDTGDSALTTSTPAVVATADGVLYTADTDGEIIYNEDPSTNTSISFRSGTGAFSVELFPVQQQ